MFEYFVMNIEAMNDSGLIMSSLNAMAREGWRVVCNTVYGLILEREKRPVIDETEKRTIIVYDWGSTLPESNHDSE